jgi:hypothetical protein
MSSSTVRFRYIKTQSGNKHESIARISVAKLNLTRDVAIVDHKRYLLLLQQSTTHKQTGIAETQASWTEVKRHKGCKLSSSLIAAPAMELANRFAVLSVEEPAIAQPTTQGLSVNQTQPKFPDLITGGLPVELEIQIYSYLSVKDLANLESTCRRPEEVIRTEENARQLARTITARETMILREGLDYVNFAGLSIVTAWHRYINLFGIHRDTQDILHAMPECGDFIQAYTSSNPGLRMSESQVDQFMNLILGLSDWCQYYEHGTAWTVLAGFLRFHGWQTAIETATGYTGEYMPGRYSTLVRVVRIHHPAMSPEFIVQALEEVRARPLQDLTLLPAAEVDQNDENIDSDSETEVHKNENDGEKAVERVVEMKRKYRQFCRGVRDKLDVPKIVHGFRACIRARTKRGMRLLTKMFFDGDQDGLLFAALVKELEICWMRVEDP